MGVVGRAEGRVALELASPEPTRGSSCVHAEEELRAPIYARQDTSCTVHQPTHVDICRTFVQLPVLMSVGAFGRDSLVRLEFSSSEVTEVEAETVRRLITAVRVQARAAAACRTVVNTELGQMFAGSGDEAGVNSALFESRAA